MKNILRAAIAALAFALCALPSAHAAVATIYIDTGGCETASTTKCSGTTDSASASAKGAGSTITCSAASGVGGNPGCIITGTNTAVGQLGSIAVDGSQALFVNCATNSNQKIFFITAVDNTTGAITTSVTPTGCTAATSDWGIGGRMIYASANIEAALRAGDTVLFNNSPASKSTAFITARTSGDSTTGPIFLAGKTGVRPKLQITNTTIVVTANSQTNWNVSNLELAQAGGSGDAASITNGGWVFNNVKISQAGGNGITVSVAGITVVDSEITGVGGDGINASCGNGGISVTGSNIHGNTGNGITCTSATAIGGTIAKNTITGNGGRGIIYSGAIAAQLNNATIINNIVFNNGNSGLEVASSGFVGTVDSNIFQNNGDAAGEYNVKWVAGNAELHGFHGFNLFFHSNCQGSNTGGPACVSGLTPNSTEVTSDALFVNSGAGNFALTSASPAKATGYPGVLLGGSTGFMSMGAVQPQSGSAGGYVIGN